MFVANVYLQIYMKNDIIEYEVVYIPHVVGAQLNVPKPFSLSKDFSVSMLKDAGNPYPEKQL